MRFFILKSLLINAVQWRGDNLEELKDFTSSLGFLNVTFERIVGKALVLSHDKRKMTLSLGSFLFIKEGEFWIVS